MSFKRLGPVVRVPAISATASTIVLALDPGLTPVIKRRNTNTAKTVNILVNKDTVVEMQVVPAGGVTITVPTER